MKGPLYLLHVVDLIVLALLVARDLPVGAVGQVRDDDLSVAVQRAVLDALTQVDPVQRNPLVQPPVNCKGESGKLECVSCAMCGARLY